MSDELLFDSERQERRAKKKRRLIPLLVLAGILLAVIAIALIVRSGKKPVHSAGEDTPYPYTWQAQSDGSLRLEISHADAPDYRWTLADGEELHILEVKRREKDSNDTTRFTLTAKEAGREIVKLLLRRGEEAAAAPASEPASKEEALELGYEEPKPEDVLFELSLLVEFAQEGEALTGTVLSASGVRRQGVLRGGGDSANPYQIYGRNQERVVAAVKNASGAHDWSYELLSGEGSVVVEGLLYMNGEIQLYLMAGERPGEGEVALRSDAAKAEIRLHCVRQEDGALLVTEHQAELSEKPAEDPAKDPSESMEPDAYEQYAAEESGFEHTEPTEVESTVPFGTFIPETDEAP